MPWGGEIMNVLTADEVMAARLQGIKEPVEIRDVSGKVLGHYTPVGSPENAELYARVEELFDLEEAERTLATQRGQGIPLEEFWRRMESRETP
jgi:hypothetical protein